MTEPGHECRACRLSGPESVTRREQVECISEAIGRKVVLEETTAEEYLDALGRRGDAEVVDTLVTHLVEADGRPAPVLTMYQDLTGTEGRAASGVTRRATMVTVCWQWNGNVLYGADATSG